MLYDYCVSCEYCVVCLWCVILCIIWLWCHHVSTWLIHTCHYQHDTPVTERSPVTINMTCQHVEVTMTHCNTLQHTATECNTLHYDRSPVTINMTHLSTWRSHYDVIYQHDSSIWHQHVSRHHHTNVCHVTHVHSHINMRHICFIVTSTSIKSTLWRWLIHITSTCVP